MEQFDITTFNPTTLITLKNEFITENSKDINNRDILYAYKTIERPKAVIKLNNLLKDIKTAERIEQGIFEFALVMMMMYNLDKYSISGLYYDKLSDLLINLDPNSYVHNNVLRSSLDKKKLNPQLIAFLSPDQLHPESFAAIISKIRFRENAEDNMAVSDAHECPNCHERKSKVSSLQLRGADEPETKFITCLVCLTTEITE